MRNYVVIVVFWVIEMKVVNWKNVIDKNELDEVCKSLSCGNLVIFPTETVYGIGAIATDEKVVKKIFIAKKRAMDNPLIVHLANVEDISKYAIISNDVEQKLIDAFMPGPFTLILKKKENIPDVVSCNLDTVGIRIPSNKIIHTILEKLDQPIAAPSANVSGRPSGTNIDDIKDEFSESVSYIIDGDNSLIGLESTVVKVVDGVPVILRPGFICEEDIREVIGDVKISSGVFGEVKGKVESPGMKYRHYAPKTKVLVLYSEENIVDLVRKNVIDRTIIIGSEKLKDVPCFKFLNYGNTYEEISHNIFTLLRKADKYNANLIIIESVKQEGLGLAIFNRLIRASGYNYISE